jgi:hypothetical protein
MRGSQLVLSKCDPLIAAAQGPARNAAASGEFRATLRCCAARVFTAVRGPARGVALRYLAARRRGSFSGHLRSHLWWCLS